MTLKGRAAELNEQRLGHAVFGRSLNYDSSSDGIVRTQASRLRQRLDLYFSGEGATEAIRIEIPKGGYVPVFKENLAFTEPRPAAVHEAKTAEDTASPVVPTSTPPLHEAEPRQKLQYIPWLICCVCALIAAASWLRPARTAAPSSPPPHPLWSRVFTPQRPTLEVPGDSGLVLSYVFTQQGVSLGEYLAGGYREPFRTGVLRGDTALAAIETDIANRRYTSIVDLAVAVNLQKLALQNGSSLQVRYARDLRPNDLKSGNAILVGALEGNPWLEMFEPRMKFRLINDYRRHVFSVVNQRPKPGEPNHWESTRADPLRRVYGVVALVPNLSGDGSVLIVEGTSMAGVEAAWDFVSDDKTLLPLLHRMQESDGTLPWFELLIGTQNLGASASHTDLVAWEAH